MNKNADIDRIFKDGLGEKNFAGKDAMWQKLEHALDENNKKRKRRIAFIMLFASILTTGFFILNILTENVDKWSVIGMELMIIIIGPLFFKEHAN